MVSKPAQVYMYMILKGKGGLTGCGLTGCGLHGHSVGIGELCRHNFEHNR